MNTETTPLNGAPTNIGFLRGLNYGSGDCDDLERALGKKLWIPDIPLYDGELPTGVDRRTEEERLAGNIAKEAAARNCRRFIAHSRGAFMALLASNLTNASSQQVQWIVMIPAAGDPMNVPIKEDADCLEDAVLHPLCATMSSEAYRLLKERHAPTLKRTLKVMNPKKYAVPVDDVRAKILALNVDIPILVIDCKHDPFRDLERLDLMIGGCPNITISAPLHCGHFPHVECPDALVETIKAWESSLGISAPPTFAAAV